MVWMWKEESAPTILIIALSIVWMVGDYLTVIKYRAMLHQFSLSELRWFNIVLTESSHFIQLSTNG